MDGPNSLISMSQFQTSYNQSEANEAVLYDNNDADALVLYDFGANGVFDNIIGDDGLAVDGGSHLVENEVGEEDDATYFANLPAGIKFAPSDYELIKHYLFKKVHGLKLPRNQILEFDLYGESPESIEEKYPREDKRWYIHTPRQKRYLNGQRPRRTALDGFWKATGADTKIFKNHKPAPNEEELGCKKTLVYLRGRSPHGVKTNWILHEFRLKNAPARANDDTNQMLLDEWVLCRLYKKPEPKKSPPPESFRAGRKERGGSGSSSEATTPSQNDNCSDKQDVAQNLSICAAAPSYHLYAEDNGAQLATHPSSFKEDALNPTFVPQYPCQTSFPSIPSSQCQSYYLRMQQQQASCDPRASNSQGSSAAVVAADGVMRRQDYKGRYFPYRSSFMNLPAGCDGNDGVMRREDYMGQHFQNTSSFIFTNPPAEAAGVGGVDGVIMREENMGQHIQYTSSFTNPLVADEIDNMILSSPGTSQDYQVDPSFPSSNF